jgi:glutathione synthase/RimK-type ligase-like ATP-grasp enzyme
MSEGTILGIHAARGSYSDRWIEYCAQRAIPFRVVDCLGTDAVADCRGLTAVLWHWSHGKPRDQVVARQVLFALQHAGIPTLPDAPTFWHYDDKVAQKYLLEAIDAPLVPSYVFTDRAEALAWARATGYPKVFKLRCGAGSGNVRLVNSRAEAEALCHQAFARGFAASPGVFNDIGPRLRRVSSPSAALAMLKRVRKTLAETGERRKFLPLQIGYVYFQDFIADNSYDTRITVIGNRAFGFRRANRPGDFRASGSGHLVYEPDAIDRQAIRTAFEVSARLRCQSLAYDFLHGDDGRPLISEISYCYLGAAVHACSGHWDPDLRWHEGQVWPQDAMLEDLLLSVGPRGVAGHSRPDGIGRLPLP